MFYLGLRLNYRVDRDLVSHGWDHRGVLGPCRTVWNFRGSLGSDFSDFIQSL